MAVVPRYNSQVREAGVPQAQANTNAPAEAFGAGASSQALGKAVTGAAQTATDIITSEKLKADQTAATEGETSLLKFKQQMLTDPKTGFQSLKGKDALASLGSYQEQFDKKVAEIQNGFTNDNQKGLFKKSSTSQVLDFNNNINQHSTAEIQKYDKSVYDTGLQAYQNDATLFWQNPGKVEESLSKQKELVQNYGSKQGLDQATIDLQFNQNKAQTLSGVINQQLIAGQTPAARKMFTDNRAAFGDNAPKIEESIKNHETLDKSVAAWNGLKGYRLADGTPDEARMQANIFARADLPQDQKEKVWDYVKSQSSQTIANKNKQDNARDYAFLNTASKLKSDGTPLAESMRLLDKYSSDDNDRRLKTLALRKLYAPNEASDPNTFIGIWEKVQDGESSKDMIDGAFQGEKLNVADWRSLREEYYRGQAEGKDPKVKLAWDRIKILADEQFGSGEENKKFLYDMHQDGKGKNPDELFKLANDKLKDDPSTGRWSFTQDEQWKTDFAKRDAKSLAWGKAYSDIGKQETSAIGAGVLRSGKKQFEPADLENFANDLGGYQNIKPGTAAHNAIQLLIKNKKPVTAANVKAILGVSVSENK